MRTLLSVSAYLPACLSPLFLRETHSLCVTTDVLSCESVKERERERERERKRERKRKLAEWKAERERHEST